MNTLVSVRTNIVYAKKKKQDEKAEDEFVRHQELIFLVDKPTYRYSNEGEIIRERGLDEVRFTVSDKAFDHLIKLLEKLKDVDDIKELDFRKLISDNEQAHAKVFFDLLINRC